MVPEPAGEDAGEDASALRSAAVPGWEFSGRPRPVYRI